jgi:hypothetical protein
MSGPSPWQEEGAGEKVGGGRFANRPWIARSPRTNRFALIPDSAGINRRGVVNARVTR